MRKRGFAAILAVMLVLSIGFVSCGDTIYRYRYIDTVQPMPDMTLAELIDVSDRGVQFQNFATRSLRFYRDGRFMIFAMGLGPARQPITGVNNVGLSFRVMSESVVYIFDAHPVPAIGTPPAYSFTYTLDGNVLTVHSLAAGTRPPPNAATFPRQPAPGTEGAPLGIYTLGQLPWFIP